MVFAFQFQLFLKYETYLQEHYKYNFNSQVTLLFPEKHLKQKLNEH